MIAELTPERLQDKDFTVLTDFNVESEVLLIVFSGVGLGIGVPYFEFLNALNDYKIRKIFVRDNRKSWYHGGIIGMGDTIDETLDPLRKLIKESGAKKIVTLGNSMGAYAAILYGVLLGADEVLAFAPTTFANWKNRFKYWDHRGHFKYLKNATIKPWKYYDLLEVPGIDKPHIQIFFDTDYRTDRAHAEHLGKSLDNVDLKRFHGGKHKVIKNIKNSGELQNIFSGTFERLQQKK
ncbi:MAG: hypothetical protein KDC34_03915 [Saprospiraceae bacterium]|nr:hypothetical protein [Saprospiraceae bacterium]